MPLRRPAPPPQPSETASSATSGDSGEPERHLRLESLTALLTTLRPSPEQAQLVARVRDTTLAALHPDEDELRARKLAARAAAARPSCATAAASISAAAASEMSSMLSTDSQAQLLPFEFPLQVRGEGLQDRVSYREGCAVMTGLVSNAQTAGVIVISVNAVGPCRVLKC